MLTIDQILAFDPCYDPDRVRKVAARYSADGTITPDVVMKVDPALMDSPDHDRVWLLSLPGMLADNTLHVIACSIVEKISLPVWQQIATDTRPAQAVAAKRGWLKQEITDADLQSARADALNAELDWSGVVYLASAARSASWAAHPVPSTAVIEAARSTVAALPEAERPGAWGQILVIFRENMT